MQNSYRKGRGSQIMTKNPFLAQVYVTDHLEGLDEELLPEDLQTKIFYETPKKIVNKVDSPDVGMEYSLNPYQGCEHGCAYCYARPTHEYWGFNAGLDFESKIVAKKNAAVLLERLLLKPSWKPKPIVLSGNTDCYQPLERKLKITRSLLEVFVKFRHPVGIISKNTLMLRDLDLLKDLAKDNLVHVILSINTLNEKLRAVLEPRTASSLKKLKAIEKMSSEGIPTMVMNAPVIPGLNHHEIPQIIKSAAEYGALSAGYTMVRLNGYIGEIFKNWLEQNFPDRFNKVWDQIKSAHGGQVNDSVFGRRMRGEGNMADMVNQLFHQARKKYMGEVSLTPLDTTKFRRGGNYQLF